MGQGLKPHQPLIVTATLAGPDQAWFDQLRQQYFPPERNVLAAHLTMFHALPPFVEEEVKTRLAQLARRRPPNAEVAGLMNLGRGVAFRVVSPDLDRVREELREAFHGLLTAQDAGGWRPHITVQNKVRSADAKALFDRLSREFSSRPLAIAGLGLHRYLGGPWERIGAYPFRGQSS